MEGDVTDSYNPRLIAQRHSNILTGWMRQFYVTYRGDEKVPSLVTQLPWTHNLIILSQSKTPEERESYLQCESAVEGDR